VEFLIEAYGCRPAVLRDLAAVRAVCERAVGELGLTVVGAPQWHQFPGEAGVTGLYLLAESHLTCHTFPEHGFASFNLYCCRPRQRWAWEARLADALGAERVAVRELAR
jgi:S-adenosylmethionine decarboxylase